MFGRSAHHVLRVLRRRPDRGPRYLWDFIRHTGCLAEPRRHRDDSRASRATRLKRDPDELCGRFVDDSRGVTHRAFLRREPRAAADAAERSRHLVAVHAGNSITTKSHGPQLLHEPEQLVARERDRAVALPSWPTGK